MEYVFNTHIFFPCILGLEFSSTKQDDNLIIESEILNSFVLTCRSGDSVNDTRQISTNLKDIVKVSCRTVRREGQVKTAGDLPGS